MKRIHRSAFTAPNRLPQVRRTWATRGSILSLGLLLLTGCPRPVSVYLDPIPLNQSVRVVNENLARIQGGLKAFGPVTVNYTDERGRQFRHNLDGTLLMVPPSHQRFEMSLFGKSQILLGSNEKTFWAYFRADDETYRWGHHAALDPDSKELPIRPDLLVEAIGLNALPTDTTGTGGPAQRIADDHQELLFLSYDPRHQAYVEKEYWLERRDRRLTRRIIFRDPVGNVQLCSDLDDYRPVSPDGPWLPTRIHIRWPRQRTVLDFHIRGWATLTQLTVDAPSFKPPHELGITYKNMRCLDQPYRVAPEASESPSE